MSHSFVGVAQLDRAFGYGPKGRGFESSRPRQVGPLQVHSARVFLRQNNAGHTKGLSSLNIYL